MPPQKDPLTSMLDGWISWYASIVQRALTAQSEIMGLAEKFVAGEPWPVGEFARLLPELASPTERLFFNVIYRGPQKFAWAEIPMAEVKAIREACGGTHNDIVLTLITATIRRYAELHGDPVRRRMLRIMVPVNVRSGGRPGDLGNRISLLPVTIPLDIRSPRRLLAAVRERMDFLKRAHVAELVGLAGGLVGTTPTLLQAFAGPMASQLPLSAFNLVCTNVPGPQAPLYLLGHKMLQWYPYVPVGGDMAVNSAILSYNGTTYFGFSGDVHAAPDLNRLEGFLKLSLEELRNAASGKAWRKKRPRPKAKVGRVPAPVATIAASPVRPLAQPVPSERPMTREDRVPMGLAAD